MSIANQVHTGALAADAQPAPAAVRTPWYERPALFRYGFAFSIGLTFLPTELSGLSWLERIGIALIA